MLMLLAFCIATGLSACSSSSEPISTTRPQPAPSTHQTSALLEKIGPKVAALRGLPTLNVPADLINREMLKTKLDQDFAKNYPYEVAKIDQLELELLGILQPTQSIVAIQKTLLTQQIIGFYDSETEEIFAVGDGYTSMLLLTWTLAHEYVHALQDQNFDLDAIEESINDNQDALLAFRALVEGDATLAGTEYVLSSLTAADIGAFGSTRNFQDDSSLYVPQALRQLLLFPYEVGSDFVASLLSGSWNAVNNAYSRLPISTEQVLHVQKYLENEQPVEVALPSLDPLLHAGWEEIRRNVVGEFYLAAILEQVADRTTAKRAAAGWGGDAYTIYRNAEGQGLIAMKFCWDNDAELDEFWQELVAFLTSEGLGAGTSKIDGTTVLWSGSIRSARAHKSPHSVLLVIGHEAQTVNLVTEFLSHN